VQFKREKAVEFGATHVAASMDEAWNVVSEITRGQLADAANPDDGQRRGQLPAAGPAAVGRRAAW